MQTAQPTSQIEDAGLAGYGTQVISMIAGTRHPITVDANPLRAASDNGPLILASTFSGNWNYLSADDGLISPVGWPKSVVEDLTNSYAVRGGGNIIIVGGTSFAGVGFTAAAPLGAPPVLTLNQAWSGALIA